jgi:small subunit ribosomal protein S16
LEIIGHYLPARKDPIFEVQAERVVHWISKGAIPSDTLARLFKRNGLKDMDKFIKTYAKQRSKKDPPPEAAPAPAPKAEEVKVEEKPAEVAAEAPKAEEAPAA